MKRLALLCSARALNAGSAWADGALDIYKWSDDISEDTIADFEAATGIKGTHEVFDSNEGLHAKRLTGSSGYDVVVPSIECMARLSAVRQ